LDDAAGRAPTCNARVDDYRTTLRRLALRDDRYVDQVLADEASSVERSGLDPRGHALARLGALIALDAPPPSYMNVVEHALAAGVTRDEIAGALVALLPVVGVARCVSAAPNLALALGFDTAAALETLDHGTA
jgi:alkylhydroperoxidase/carboxymuconolactone decarboxylase family protein YurZ